MTRPERLQETTRVGRFDVELEVDVTGGPVPGDVAARLESEHDGLELIAAEPVDGGLVLRFDGRQAGAHVGVLRVSHTNPRVVSRGVRFGFDIGGNSEAEAQEIDVDLGTVVAGHGVLKVSIPLRVSDTDPARYQVLVRDLARGGTVLPTTAPRTLEVERTGARLIVEVEIGDVPAGEYGGALVMTPKGQAGKRWNVLLKLAVTNALQADVLDFGIVGAGTIATARGIIRNRSAKSVTGVTISLPTSMAHEDRPVQGLEFRAEERIGEIPAGQERSVEVTVAVPDTIGVRGDVTGRVLVNSDGTTIEVPVRLKLVNSEAVRARFRVIPSRLELTGPAGRVIRFSLRLRASPDVQRAHTIRVEAQPLTKSDGSRSTAVVDFGKTTEVTLFPDRPLDLTGMVLLPETGAAQSELVLSGAGAGRVVVPVMLKTR